RLPPACLRRRNPFACDARAAAALDKLRLPFVVFFGDRDEVPAGVLDGAARDAAQDAAFLDTLDGRLLVVYAVASARVEEAAPAPTASRVRSCSTQRSVRSTAFFQPARPCCRCSALHFGSKTLSTCQFLRSSSSVLQKPVASPAPYAAPSDVVSWTCGRTTLT